MKVDDLTGSLSVSLSNQTLKPHGTPFSSCILLEHLHQAAVVDQLRRRFGRLRRPDFNLYAFVMLACQQATRNISRIGAHRAMEMLATLAEQRAARQKFGFKGFEYSESVAVACDFSFS